jgi:hypothetical protein
MADGKGRGYKASDERSIFCCHTCHSWLDQGKASPEEKDAAFAKAQERTKARLVEIAESPSVRAWKRDAAQWALNLLN